MVRGDLPAFDYAGAKNAFDRGALGVEELAERLSDGWAAGYRSSTAGGVELVEVDQGAMTYLFDIAHERVVGVYGRSAAPTSEYPKADARLPAAAFAFADGSRTPRRAHARRRRRHQPRPPGREANVSGAWRALERWAQARAGTFISVEVLYDDDTQTPARFVYLVADEREVRYERFDNR